MEEDKTIVTNAIEYKPEGMNEELIQKIGNRVTAFLITASLITCTYSMVHSDYEQEVTENVKQTHKLENWFALDRGKQFVSGLLIMEAGILNHIYLNGETKKR